MHAAPIMPPSKAAAFPIYTVPLYVPFDPTCTGLVAFGLGVVKPPKLAIIPATPLLPVACASNEVSVSVLLPTTTVAPPVTTARYELKASVLLSPTTTLASPVALAKNCVRATVLLPPTTTLRGAPDDGPGTRLIACVVSPDTRLAGALTSARNAFRACVWLPTMTLVGTARYWLKGAVVPATTTLEPPAWILTTVPETVTAAPGTRVCEPMMYAEGAAGAGEETARFCVVLAATTRLAPLDAREYTVSACVICPPGMRV